MANWCFLAGVLFQCASHAFATAHVGKVSLSCSALLRDVNALQGALATMWELRDTPDAEYPPATRAIAVCAWTALEPALKLVGEPVLEGRLLSPYKQIDLDSINTSRHCDAVKDVEEFVDEDGISCARWSFMDCYKELGFTASRLKAVQQSCAFTCAGCARDATMLEPPSVQFAWEMALLLYSLMLVAVVGIALCTQMRVASCGCVGQLKVILALLKHLAVQGSSFLQRSDAEKSETQYVTRTKALIRRRLAMLYAISLLSGSFFYWNMTRQSDVCFRSDLEKSVAAFNPMFWLLTYGVYLCPLLPQTVFGQRGMTVFGFLLILILVGQECHNNAGAVILLKGQYFARTASLVVTVLAFKFELGCSIHLTQSVAILICWAWRFGFGRVFFYSSREGRWCYVFDDSRPLDPHPGHPASFALGFYGLLIPVIREEIIVVVIQCGFDRALDSATAAMERLAQMESHAKVFMSLMTLMCDCVVQLDGELAIREPNQAHGLAALLLIRRGHRLEGTDFRSFLATDDDVNRLNNALLERNANSSNLLHIRMRDTIGTELHVHVYWMCAEHADGSLFFILGITEESERKIPPPNTDGDGDKLDERLEFLQIGRIAQIPEYARSASQESGSQSSLCSSLGASHIFLRVMPSWPMAILGSNCQQLHTGVHNFSQLFSQSKQAKKFHQRLERELEQVAIAGESFPVFRVLGTVKLCLEAIGSEHVKVRVTLEVVDDGENDGSGSSRGGVRDRIQTYGKASRQESQSIKWVGLHLASARKTALPQMVKGTRKKHTPPNREKLAIGTAAEVIEEAREDNTPSNQAALRMKL